MRYPIPNETFCSGMHPAQRAVLDDFDDRKHRFWMLKWHRRARKTTLAVNILLKEAFRNPNGVYCYVGPTYRQAKAIVWRDPHMLFSYLPPKETKAWKANESELFVRLANGSMVVIKGADEPDSLRGIDAAGVVFDEYAMFSHPEVWDSIFRPIIAQDEKRWAMFLYTPAGENHATQLWRQAQGWEGWKTSVLRASESKLLPQSELDKARAEMPLWLYDQEFECSDITDEDMVLITSRLIESLQGVHRSAGEIRRIISCDPAASLAGDATVTMVHSGAEVEETLVEHERDAMKIAGRLAVISGQTGINDIIVDSIGVGHGIACRLQEMGKRVIAYNSAETSNEPKRFANKRAEVWWYCMEEAQRQGFEYPTDPLLRQELCAVRVKALNSRGKILMEPKDKVRERIGRSPDRGDSFTMGRWGLQFVSPIGESDPWFDDETETADSYSMETCL